MAEDSKTGSLYSIVLPPQAAAWQAVRVKVVDRAARLDDAASLACSDPAIALQFLKLANSMQYSAGRPPATTMKMAIERLGHDVAAKSLDELKLAPAPDPVSPLAHCLEDARRRCTRVGKVSRIFADHLAKTLNEDCELAGAFYHIGEMLAVVAFGEQYLKIWNEQKVRAKILYRLDRDHQFNASRSGMLYLKRTGVPDLILFVYDHSIVNRNPSRGPMRMICAAASELVLAFETDKFEKYAPPGDSIPSTSAVRILKMTPAQYEAIYRASGEVLNPSAESSN